LEEAQPARRSQVRLDQRKTKKREQAHYGADIRHEIVLREFRQKRRTCGLPSLCEGLRRVWRIVIRDKKAPGNVTACELRPQLHGIQQLLIYDEENAKQCSQEDGKDCQHRSGETPL
jgi:hypothetical protein